MKKFFARFNPFIRKIRDDFAPTSNGTFGEFQSLHKEDSRQGVYCYEEEVFAVSIPS